MDRKIKNKLKRLLGKAPIFKTSVQGKNVFNLYKINCAYFRNIRRQSRRLRERRARESQKKGEYTILKMGEYTILKKGEDTILLHSIQNTEYT